MMKYLRDASFQTIYSTHSDIMIDIGDWSSIKRLDLEFNCHPKKEKLEARDKTMRRKNYKLKNLSSEAVAEVLEKNFEKIKIIDLNSEGLIISGSKDELIKVDQIIEKLDQPQKQIMIKARVEEISRTKIIISE